MVTTPAATPAITAAICTYERYDVLPLAIESVARQSLPPDAYRILVIDNSVDGDRGREFARSFAHIPNLTYRITSPPGLSTARNLALAECATEFIAFIDDDAVADPDWLAEIRSAFDLFGPRVQVIGGRIAPLWGAERPPWLHDVLLGRLSVIDCGDDARIARPGDGFAGANIAFRTSAALACGGFAAHLGRVGSGVTLLSNEEIALLDQIVAAGGLKAYAPKARVSHMIPASRLSRAWFRKRAAWQAVSDFMMDPQRFSARSGPCWDFNVGYFNSLPPHERTIFGYLLDTDDPDLFLRQTDAIYSLTIMALAGFDGAGGDPDAR